MKAETITGSKKTQRDGIPAVSEPELRLTHKVSRLRSELMRLQVQFYAFIVYFASLKPNPLIGEVIQDGCRGDPDASSFIIFTRQTRIYSLPPDGNRKWKILGVYVVPSSGSRENRRC